MTERVAVATGFGGPEVLEVRETVEPVPQPGEVVVSVRASGTNPIDVKFYSGRYGSDPAMLPMRLGLEGSGVVSAVNGVVEGPTGRLAIGDEVVFYPAAGTYATKVAVPAANTFHKSPASSFEEASGLLLTGTTAVHALTATGVTAGDTLLLHGAAGGVGLMAIQLAVAKGARVIGTASLAQHDLLRSLGAEPVVYGDGLIERVRELVPEGVDAAIDLVGSDEAGDVSVALVDDWSRLATIVPSGRAGTLGVKSLGMGPNSDPGAEIRDVARGELITQLGEGTLKVIVERTYALDDVVSAHLEILAGHAHGKIVLIP